MRDEAGGVVGGLYKSVIVLTEAGELLAADGGAPQTVRLGLGRLLLPLIDGSGDTVDSNKVD